MTDRRNEFLALYAAALTGVIVAHGDRAQRQDLDGMFASRALQIAARAHGALCAVESMIDMTETDAAHDLSLIHI